MIVKCIFEEIGSSAPQVSIYIPSIYRYIVSFHQVSRDKIEKTCILFCVEVYCSTTSESNPSHLI